MLKDWFNKLVSINEPLRPPGAIEEKLFLQKCIRCRKCEEVCPYGSIITAHGNWGLAMGTPIVSVRDIPCYLCEDFPCIDVCPSEALVPVDSKEEVKMGLAIIDETLCLPYNGILCRACYERCPIYSEAITLKDQLYPVVHEDKCVGCGICVNVCPAETVAISVKSFHKDI